MSEQSQRRSTSYKEEKTSQRFFRKGNTLPDAPESSFFKSADPTISNSFPLLPAGCNTCAEGIAVELTRITRKARTRSRGRSENLNKFRCVKTRNTLVLLSTYLSKTLARHEIQKHKEQGGDRSAARLPIERFLSVS